MQASSLTVEIDGRRLRVLFENDECERVLSAALGDLICDSGTDDEVGFLISDESIAGGFARLADRSGLVLAKRRSLPPLLDDTVGLIRSFARPAGSSICLQVRAVTHGDVLALGDPLDMAQLADSRRLIERRGGIVRPSMRTWFDAAGRDLESNSPISRFAFVGHPLDPPLTTAQKCFRLVSSVRWSESRAQALRWCEDIAGAIDFVRIDGNRPPELAAALVPAL